MYTVDAELKYVIELDDVLFCKRRSMQFVEVLILVFTICIIFCVIFVGHKKEYFLIMERTKSLFVYCDRIFVNKKYKINPNLNYHKDL